MRLKSNFYLLNQKVGYEKSGDDKTDDNQRLNRSHNRENLSKTFKITKKHVNFLRFIYLGMNQADAFIEAGFRAKTHKSASSGSSLLLEKLRNLPEGQQLFKAFNPIDEISQDLANLRKHPDPRIRLDANKVAAGVHGLGKEEVSQNFGFQVIIGGRQMEGEKNGRPALGEQQKPGEIQPAKKPAMIIR